jgi:ornithine decarboxylase
LESYQKAIINAKELFDYCKTHWNKDLSILDLGGGWLGTDDESFKVIVQMITQLTQILFSPNVHFMAQPGRYFAAKTTTLIMRVLGKKRSQHTNQIEYYLSNGVFGFFITSLYFNFDAEKILNEGWVFRPLNVTFNHNVLSPSLLWGPTCDSGDKIIEGILLPEMRTGDFLSVENVGAYCQSVETSFNGIPLSKPYYILERR